VTLQKVMELVNLNDGPNAFNLPRVGKDKPLVCDDLVQKREGDGSLAA
jgi:hypothetical protein